MAPDKELIVHLIVQDMRHFQFIHPFEKAGLDVDNQFLDIMNCVARMMGLPWKSLPDIWVNTYMMFLDKAVLLPMNGSREHLHALAEECYDTMTILGVNISNMYLVPEERHYG